MFYFKTIHLTEFDKNGIESALRHFALKRHTSLDFKGASYEHTHNKYFLGLESDKYLRLTRIKTPLEGLIPKLIIRFHKQNFGAFSIRYSLLPSLALLLLVILLGLGVAHSISTGQVENYLVLVATVALLFVALTLLEIKLTTQKVKNAIEKGKKDV